MIEFCITINLLSIVISAFFWTKLPLLRKLPIIINTLSGITYALLSPTVSSFSKGLKIVTISFVMGCAFYFFVWVQARMNDN